MGPESQRSIEAKSTRPAVAAAQNSVSVTAASPAGAPQHALHVEDRPVAVERLDDPVAERERREEPERARGARRLRSARRPPAASPRLSAPSGSDTLQTMRAARSPPTVSGSPHQIPRPTNRATKTGASAVPRPSRALSASTATSTRRGNSEAASALTTGIVSPKPIPMSAVAPRREAKAAACVPSDESARDEQRHRRQIGAEAQQEDALFSPPSSESAAEQRGGHRQDGLGREHDAVLAVREAVRVRVGEHGAGRREGDQGQPLQEAGRVDRADLLPRLAALPHVRRWPPRRSPARHRRRWRRWSPTRSAFAIAVSPGFTAPMLGKKLVSTT